MFNGQYKHRCEVVKLQWSLIFRTHGDVGMCGEVGQCCLRYGCPFILPENVYGPLTFRLHCYWYIDRHMPLQLTTVQLG